MSLAKIVAQLVERGEEDLAEELLGLAASNESVAKIPILMKVNVPVTEKLDSGELRALESAVLSALESYKPHPTEKEVLKKVMFD